MAHTELSLGALPSIDRDLLHVFVVGPGTGEGVAIGLPAGGWLLIDACKVDKEVPLLKLVERYRLADEPVQMILTHPHEDHASGFAEAVEALEPVAIHLAAKTPAGPHLLAIARSSARVVSPTSARLRERGVLAALRAIEFWEREDRKVSTLVAGMSLDVGTRVRGRACAPRVGSHLNRILDEIGTGNRARANDAAIVVDLQFGKTRVVLGADLPTTRRLRDVPTGWNAVMTDFDELAAHALLKIPHHGSEEAHHSGLMAPCSSAWCCTPFAKTPLPDLVRGVPALLAANDTLLLTHPPAAWHVPEGLADLPIASVSLRRTASPTGDPFADAADDVTPRPPATWSSSCWGFAFDSENHLVSILRGSSALRLRAS